MSNILSASAASQPQPHRKSGVFKNTLVLLALVLLFNGAPEPGSRNHSLANPSGVANVSGGNMSGAASINGAAGAAAVEELPVPLAVLERKFREKLFPNNVLPKIKVLVVEDNVINQIILSNFLKKNNIPFTLISNGRDALKEWRKGGYQLILMDIQLPFISGIYCAKEIRRLESVNGIGVSNYRDIHNLISSGQKISSEQLKQEQKMKASGRNTSSTSSEHTSPNRKPISSISSPRDSPKFQHAQISLQAQQRPKITPENTTSNIHRDRVTELQTSSDAESTHSDSPSLITSPISETAIANELKREDSPNPLTDETASDKLDVLRFKQPVIIVALTANSFTEDRDNALAAGCNDFLVKPVNLLWLGKKFTEWGCMQALINFDGWEGTTRRQYNQTENEKSLKRNKALDVHLKRLLTQALAR